MDTNTDRNTPAVAQLMLPGQAAAPEGPVDMSVMYVMHHGFRRDLRDFCDAARSTPVGARDTWRALGVRWDMFARILHFHHSGEDAGLWPWLRQRATEQEAVVLDAMEAEHDEIDPMLAACGEGLARMVTAPSEDLRAALVVRLVAARDSLDRHLAHEETDAMPILQRVMTQEDWLAVDKEHFVSRLTLRELKVLVPWCEKGTPAGLRAEVLAKSGLMFRVVGLLTRRSFARADRRAFGTS